MGQEKSNRLSYQKEQEEDVEGLRNLALGGVCPWGVGFLVQYR